MSSNKDSNSSFLSLIIILVGANLLLLSILRFGFIFTFSRGYPNAPFGEYANALYLGLKFDLRLILIETLPLFLLGGFRLLSPIRSMKMRKFWGSFLTLIFSFNLIAYSVDIAHFSYVKTRLNATVLEQTKNPFISAQVVWESYPVIWVSLLLLLVIFAYTSLFLPWIFNHSGKALNIAFPKKLIPKAMTSFLVFLIYASLIYGKISWYPLRWSDAFFSTNPLISAISLNPVLYFFNTLKNRKAHFKKSEVLKYSELLSNYLESEPNSPKVPVDRASSSLDLKFHRTSHSIKGPFPQNTNVIFVILESFTSYKTGIYGNPLNPTPNLDGIAKNGWYFPNFYVPCEGTARSVFSFITGIPDVYPIKTASRNPLFVNQHTVLNEFKNHDKLYFLGGSASWGNIRGFLKHNIKNLEIFEEGDYSSPRNDVWGISDLHLFDESIKILSQRTKPFVAIVQTAGNHRPYTIPEDNRGFETWNEDEAKVIDHGFHSLKEYNSFRFMDHSIGEFFKNAAKKPFYKNTLFVLFGDHGLPGHATHLSEADKYLELTRYRVPLILYHPGKITEPKVFSLASSELDVLPTIAATLGIEHTNTTLGKNLLRYKEMKNLVSHSTPDHIFPEEAVNKKYAFSFTSFQTPPILNLIGRNKAVRILPGKGIESYTLGENGDTKLVDPRELDEEFKEMEKLCRGMYETSKYLLENNPSVTK